MNTSFATVTLLSFYQWLDYTLLQNAQAYFNTSGQFYYQPDSRLPSGYVAYASSFRSFVWDSGVSGATIIQTVNGFFFDASGRTSSGMSNVYSGVFFPQIDTTQTPGPTLQIAFSSGSYVSIVSGTGYQSGNDVWFTDSLAQTLAVRISGSGGGQYIDVAITTNGNGIPINRGDYGMSIDYANGRVIFASGDDIGYDAVLSGSYAVKDVNAYFANQSAERMVFTDKYYLNSRFARQATGIPPPYDMVTPCLFASNVREVNAPWALGGTYATDIEMTVNVLGETLPQVETVMQVLVDSVDTVFPQIPTSAYPLNSLGDTAGYGKSGYSYPAVRTQYGTTNNLFYITSVEASKVNDGVRIDEGIFCAVCDVKLSRFRTIR